MPFVLSASVGSTGDDCAAVEEPHEDFIDVAFEQPVGAGIEVAENFLAGKKAAIRLSHHPFGGKQAIEDGAIMRHPGTNKFFLNVLELLTILGMGGYIGHGEAP